MSTTAKRPLDLSTSSADSSESAGSNDSNDSKHSPDGIEEPKRKGNKPGRKPLDDEAKNKRTAQNRAAQRAFRERKERKMKELEEKVRSLEQINQQSAVETEFLRTQLMTLMTELKKYRPSNGDDSQVLAYLASNDMKNGDKKNIEESINKKMDFTFAFPWKDKSNAGEQFPSPGSSCSTSGTQSSSKAKNIETSPLNALDSMTDTAGITNNINNNSNNNNNNNNNNINNTPSSTNTSGWMDNVFYSDDAQKLPAFPVEDKRAVTTLDVSNPLAQDSVLFSNHFNFDDEFDEQVSRFCTKMNEACGTKECPIPKRTPKSTPLTLSNTWDSYGSLLSPEYDATSKNGANSAVSVSTNNILKNDINDNTDNDTNQKNGSHTVSSGGNISASLTGSPTSTPNDKPLNILNNDSINNFIIDTNDEGLTTRQEPIGQQDLKNEPLPFLDTSLAFPNENDQSLIFRDSQGSNLFAEFLDENPEIAKNNDFETKLINEEPMQSVDLKPETLLEESVVPSRDGKLLKCSEVWDRITSHPKYTSIDIDGLCCELMAKAKCSENGVVVQAEHVQNALERQAAVDND